MAQELGKYNIRVNSVNPAAVYTNIYVASGDYTSKWIFTFAYFFWYTLVR